MKAYICLLTLCTFLIGFSAFSQIQIDANHELWGQLDQGVQKKVIRGNKLLFKAIDYSKKATDYEKQKESLKQKNGRVSMSNVRKAERKRNSCIIQSKPFYEDGYEHVYEALCKQTTILLKADNSKESSINDLSKKAKEHYKKGHKSYNKSKRMVKPEEQIEFIVLGGQKMVEAIKQQMEVVVSLQDVTNASEMVDSVAVSDVVVQQPTIQVPVVSEAPTVAPVVVTVAAVAAVTVIPANKPETALATVEPSVVKEIKPLGDVFISIQILSLKTAATPEQIKQAYSGSLPVMEFVSADYYRYAIGKYRTSDEAKTAMAANGIKGIVVAFKGNDRITITEAASLINAGL